MCYDSPLEHGVAVETIPQEQAVDGEISDVKPSTEVDEKSIQIYNSELYQTLDSLPSAAPSTSNGASISFVNPAYLNKTAHNDKVQMKVWPLTHFFLVCFFCKKISLFG